MRVERGAGQCGAVEGVEVVGVRGVVGFAGCADAGAEGVAPVPCFVMALLRFTGGVTATVALGSGSGLRWAAQYAAFLHSDEFGVVDAAVVAEFFFQFFEFRGDCAEGFAARVLAEHLVGVLEGCVGFFELADCMARTVCV